jgi:HSP20 family protein
MLDMLNWAESPWSVWNELDSIQDDVSRLLGGGQRRAWQRRPAYPPLNVWYSDDGVVIDVEIPGADPEKIDIAVMQDELTLSGSVGVDAEDRKYYRRERPTGEFRRTLRLPFSVNSEGVTANYKNGVLRILVPRSEETKPRKIAINAG